MDKKQIEERIKYLEIELAQRGFWDGWSIQGMEKELEKLKKKLDLNDQKVVN